MCWKLYWDPAEKHSKTCLGLGEYYEVLLYVSSEKKFPWISIERFY